MRFQPIVFMIAILTLLVFQPAPRAQAQIELQKIGLLRKEVWTPWVMNPANNECIKYTYSMGMKPDNGKDICDVGDMVLLNALLCYSGDKKACDYVVASQDSKGKFYRSPMHAMAGGKYPGTATEFSRDHMLGVMLYLVSDPDRNRAHDVAVRWQKWLNTDAVLTPKDLVEFAGKISDATKREATNAANCAARTACWKEATLDTWEDLSKNEKIVCGLIAGVVNPLLGITCPSVIKNGQKLKKEGGPGIFSTFLPHVCDGDESRCVVSPQMFSIMYKLWLNLGLIPDHNMILFQAIETEQTIVDNAGGLGGSDLHLLAIKGLIRQRINEPSAKIFARINSREPNNPFYMFLFNKFNNEELPWSTIAARVLESCPTDVTDKDRTKSSVWLWKVKDIDGEKDKTALWDCIFMANMLGAKNYSYLRVASSIPFTLKVRRNETPSINATVARDVTGGIPPLRYELLSKPSDYSYFAFEAETGNFLLQPVNAYFGGSFKFAVTDATGRRVESTVTVTFDRSEIYPGHPPLTETPVTPLPANIYPTFTLTNTETSQVRTLSDSAPSPAELLTVTTGTLAIQAEAFIENVDESYDGKLDCTLEWIGKDATANLIKDADEFPKNFFIQKSVPVSSLEPYEVRLFRMNCFAPDMPIVVKDIPVVYVPSVVALTKPLDKPEYTYASSNGATLKLTLNTNASTSFNREYSYTLNSVDCGRKTGTLTAATNANKLTIDGSFDGLLASGDSQKMVWLNALVCDQAQPIVWKLLSSNSTLPNIPAPSNALCRYEHKKDTAGGKSGQLTSLDGNGKSKSCDKKGDWKTSCKDGNSDTDEVSCEDGQLLPPPPVTNAMCQYKHKKDTSGGKSGQVTTLDAAGKNKSCDKNGDWKTTCKDGNSDTDEVGCETGPVMPPPPPPAAGMCQYKHKKDTNGGKNGQTTGLDGSGKSKSCDRDGDWKTSCKDSNSDTDEVACK